ncbi:calcium-binding protein [Abyssibius alkaniclasticus]|uniref:calcium-binding protein n=1 Tax=Abyssibius alkaniclasticus TaxID=2881234 RepID=UPI0040591C93
MGSAVATVFSGTQYQVSDTVEKDFFGGNIIFTRDKSDGTFAQKVEYFGINLLRYPGGEVTESYFNINDPDALLDTESTETLSKFLAYCSANDIKPVIVIPIKNYINGGTPVEQAASEVREFVARVTSGEFGDVQVPMFEIGNEFNLGKTPVTAAQYGEYASAFALAIKEGAIYDVDVAVQVGTHWNDVNKAIQDNNDILAAFEQADALGAVDQLVAHTYAVEFENVENIFSIQLSDPVLDAWNAATGRDLDIFVSEWNVQSFREAPLAGTYGLAQVATMIEMTSEMLKLGVDSSAIWGIQQNTRTDLGWFEGTDKIRIGGEIYRMLSSDLVGTKVLHIPQDVIADGQVAIHAFDSDSKLVVFVSALDLKDDTAPFTMDLVISTIADDFKYVWGEKLTTDNGFIFNPHIIPVLTTLHPTMIYDIDSVKFDITFDRDYETFKFVFVKDAVGKTPLNLIGNEINDTFIAGRGDDVVRSMDGDDYVKSLAGDDRIWAGEGDDIVLGGNGNDTIYGEAGNDSLKGGRGQDILFGGSGDDILRSGSGNDTASGGSGNDKIAGGTGDDLLNAGEGNDTVWGGAGDDTLNGDQGNDKLKGGEGNDILIGGDGNDKLWGGGGEDTFMFSSNSGDDKIRDFESGIDNIQFQFDENAQIEQQMSGRGLVINYGESSILLVGVHDFVLDSSLSYI